jgi:hypothetical protein
MRRRRRGRCQSWEAELSVGAADNFHIGVVDNFVVVIGATAADVGVFVAIDGDFTGVRVAVGDAGVRMVVSDVDQFCDGTLRSRDYFYIGAIASRWSKCDCGCRCVH